MLANNQTQQQNIRSGNIGQTPTTQNNPQAPNVNTSTNQNTGAQNIIAGSKPTQTTTTGGLFGNQNNQQTANNNQA